VSQSERRLEVLQEDGAAEEVRQPLKLREIGAAEDIELEKEIERVHYRGSPFEEAELIKRMGDAGFSQKEIGSRLRLSQPQVAKRLALFNLTPRLFARLRDGSLRPSVAYMLSRMGAEAQTRFESERRVTVKDVSTQRRSALISSELSAELPRPSGIPDPQEGHVQKRVVKCPNCGAEVPVDG